MRATIMIPRGWRRLRSGSRIECGDMRSECDSEEQTISWVRIAATGWIIPSPANRHRTYIRRIPNLDPLKRTKAQQEATRAWSRSL